MNLFVYIATIVIVRILLRLWPKHAPKIGNFQMHHYMYGAVLVGAYFLIPLSALLAIGTGLIVDELSLFFIFKGFNWPDNHWKQYQSWQSILTIVAASILITTFLPH